MDQKLDGIIDAYEDFRYVYESGFSYTLEIKKVKQSSVRPFGVKYAFKLFDKNKKRVLCFDNADGSFKGYKAGKPYDHWHKNWKGIVFKKRYDYTNSQKLCEDFFKEHDKIMNDIEGE